MHGDVEQRDALRDPVVAFVLTAWAMVMCHAPSAFSQLLQPLRTVTITTTTEGGGARPEVAATTDQLEQRRLA
jgi:hypothetical protein